MIDRIKRLETLFLEEINTLITKMAAQGSFGGIVTIDIAPFIDGSLDPEQEAALRFVGEHITLGRSSENESIQDRCL